MLDPRRPNTPPNPNELAEGLMQYHPFLFLDPRNLVTMNETVLGLSRVATTPAVIESATLVLACGVDLFFTRATPSKTFDLLAADFNHSFLLALLGGLAVATVALKRIDRDKKMKAAWQ
jgi:ER membrane protein complex subunit 1